MNNRLYYENRLLKERFPEKKENVKNNNFSFLKVLNINYINFEHKIIKKRAMISLIKRIILLLFLIY